MKVSELLDSSEKWTQGVLARDNKGHHVETYSPEASSFCLIGAIDKCYREDYPINNQWKILKRVSEAISGKTRHSAFGTYEMISCWNDSPERKFEEVKNLVVSLGI